MTDIQVPYTESTRWSVKVVKRESSSTEEKHRLHAGAPQATSALHSPSGLLRLTQLCLSFSVLTHSHCSEF
eukprot:4893714-Pleurochrysis_carterae.AAC.1